MNFLIIHGSYGKPEGNWFPWLKQELEKLGHTVYLPKFPTPEGQNLESWTKVVEELGIAFNKNLVIVAHSIGPSFALSLLETRQCRACFFVSGFISLLGNPEYDKVNESFVTKDFKWKAIKQNCSEFIMYHGDNDPYVRLHSACDLADKLGIKLKVIPDGGHLNAESDYLKFPELLDDIKKLSK